MQLCNYSGDFSLNQRFGQEIVVYPQLLSDFKQVPPEISVFLQLNTIRNSAELVIKQKIANQPHPPPILTPFLRLSDSLGLMHGSMRMMGRSVDRV